MILHEISKPVFFFFVFVFFIGFEKNKEHIVNFSSAELTQKMVKLNGVAIAGRLAIANIWESCYCQMSGNSIFVNLLLLDVFYKICADIYMNMFTEDLSFRWAQM